MSHCYAFAGSAGGIKLMGCPGMQLSVRLSVCESVFHHYVFCELDIPQTTEEISIRTYTNTFYIQSVNMLGFKVRSSQVKVMEMFSNRH